MRFIPWDKEIAATVTANYRCLEKPWTKNTTIGNVAEALVQRYYGQPINLAPLCPDDGYDLLVNGVKVDVKNCTQDIQWFGHYNHEWTVNCYHGLRAEAYLFVETDPFNEKIALIGWLTPEEIVKRGKFVRRGELVHGRPSNGDCYRITASDLWPID